jgi:hypothetical protein
MIDRWNYRPEPEDEGEGERTVKRPVTVEALANALGVKVFKVIKDLIRLNVYAKNGNVVVSDAHAVAIADARGVRLVIED